MRRHVVLHVANESVADGLMQWPPARELIETRLGPTALSVLETNVEALRRLLAELGIALRESELSS